MAPTISVIRLFLCICLDISSIFEYPTPGYIFTRCVSSYAYLAVIHIGLSLLLRLRMYIIVQSTTLLSGLQCSLPPYQDNFESYNWSEKNRIEKV